MQWDLEPSFYSNYGVTYKVKYLRDVFPDVVHFSREDQTEFADAITRRFVTNTDFCWLTMMAPECEQSKYNYLIEKDDRIEMTVMIGNAAYIAENCPHYFRAQFQSSYENMIKHFANIHSKPEIVKRIDKSQKINWFRRVVSKIVCLLINPIRIAFYPDRTPVNCGLPY